MALKKEIAKLQDILKYKGFEPILFLDKKSAKTYDFSSVDPRTVVFIDDISEVEQDEY